MVQEWVRQGIGESAVERNRGPGTPTVTADDRRGGGSEGHTAEWASGGLSTRSDPSDQRRGSAGSGGRTSRPLQAIVGLVAGFLAFVVGYVGLYVLEGQDIMDNFMLGFQSAGGSVAQLEQLGATLPEQWTVVDMVYHSVHNVPYEATVDVPGGTLTETVGPRPFFAGDPIPWLLPMIALLGAGFTAASLVDVDSVPDGAIGGAAVLVGYLPVAVVSTFLFTWQPAFEGAAANTSLSMGPQLVTAAIFAGVLYPVVFGGVGGVLGSVLAGALSDDRDRSGGPNPHHGP